MPCAPFRVPVAERQTSPCNVVDACRMSQRGRANYFNSGSASASAALASQKHISRRMRRYRGIHGTQHLSCELASCRRLPLGHLNIERARNAPHWTPPQFNGMTTGNGSNHPTPAPSITCSCSGSTKLVSSTVLASIIVFSFPWPRVIKHWQSMRFLFPLSHIPHASLPRGPIDVCAVHTAHVQ